jgi:hypothetical protein
MIFVNVLVWENHRGFGMAVPGLPGVQAQGDTYDACLAVLRRLVRDRLLAGPLDTESLAGRLTVVPLEPPPE